MEEAAKRAPTTDYRPPTTFSHHPLFGPPLQGRGQVEEAAKRVPTTDHRLPTTSSPAPYFLNSL